MPVRQLVGEMGDVLTTLTPCLMMSPLSVAQFLPPDQQLFDLVVFDEASQITVPDAIGAIARGRRSIIVGDPKQMPPTSFFERGAEDEANEEAQDLESILDEALAARMPHYRLTGHYRSRHESLICFSNHAYYGGELVTYPSPSTAASAVTLPPGRWHLRARQGPDQRDRGEGGRRRGGAAPAPSRALRRSRSASSPSTPSSSGWSLDLLDQARRADPDLERFFGDGVPEPVFVKNLETVQGDQRDVILLSVGYGPTEPGARTMPMNFGPLNRKGGERRLNVAITRATTEVVVFASFDAAMIDLTRTSSEAVRDLKTYLDFAERGPVALGGAIRSESHHAYANDFEQAVADGLRRRGWTVHTQIGVSKFSIDLGIVHPDAPGRYLAGVECDGATYHAMATARDRDRVRQIVLENLGWTILRVWSTDYFIDPEAALDRLHAGIEKVLDTERASELRPCRCRRRRGGGRGSDAGAGRGCRFPSARRRPRRLRSSPGRRMPLLRRTRTEGTEDARRAFPLVAGAAAGVLEDPASAAGGATPDPQRFYDPSYRRELAAMAVAIIDAEGPVTFQALCVRIARAHGFQRTGREIVATIRAALRRQRRMTATPDGEVCWPEGMAPAKVDRLPRRCGARLEGRSPPREARARRGARPPAPRPRASRRRKDRPRSGARTVRCRGGSPRASGCSALVGLIGPPHVVPRLDRFRPVRPRSDAPDHGSLLGGGLARRARHRRRSRRAVRSHVPRHQHHPDAPALHALRSVDLPHRVSGAGKRNLSDQRRARPRDHADRRARARRRDRRPTMRNPCSSTTPTSAADLPYKAIRTALKAEIDEDA